MKILVGVAENRMYSEYIDQKVLCDNVNNINKGIKYKPVVRDNKCIKCEQGCCDKLCDKENRLPSKYSSNGMKTPTKLRTLPEPMTPTSNLKMLVSAASVLAPAQSTIKEEKCHEDSENMKKMLDNIVPQVKLKKGELMGRKEKSLGLLCKKFMMIYPEYSPNGTTILLDDVVKALSIGRRRVYDIVNVLESMEMMVRQAKNKYLWFGKSRLESTLTKLKALALRVYGPNFCYILKRYHHIIGLKSNAKVEEKYTHLKEGQEAAEPINDATNLIMDDIISYDLNRRENNRSLGILCQKFIMLFMVAQERIVTLDRAAKLLITEPDEGPAKYKTKVRRLYDIANILTSINFLEKCVSYEDATKKAAYKWVGVDLNSINSGEDTNKAFEAQEFSMTRHSLLSQLPRKQLETGANQRKFHCRSASAHQLTSPGTHLQSTGKLKFPRTFSATMVKNEGKEQNIDGFDVEKWSCGSASPVATAGCKEDKEKQDSPNESLFKEKLRCLQEEFPDKLPANRLVDLLNTDNKPRSLRRSLSTDFEADNDAPAQKKAKLVDHIITTTKPGEPATQPPSPAVNKHASPVAQGVVNTGPLYYAALKPLLSYAQLPTSSEASKSHIGPATASQLKLRENGKWQQPAYLTIPAHLKKSGNVTTESQSISPMLISPVGRPISMTKNGLYQIIPVQCQPYSENREGSILRTFNVPLVVNQQPPTMKSSSASPVTPIMMRAPVVTMPSPSVLISPKTVLRKNISDATLPTSQMSENYTEFVTPPHVFIRGIAGKPPANPIIFPKMTPETPSTEPYPSLNAVTRKLMSLQQENV